jgi:hypothetical protein
VTTFRIRISYGHDSLDGNLQTFALIKIQSSLTQKTRFSLSFRVLSRSHQFVEISFTGSFVVTVFVRYARMYVPIFSYQSIKGGKHGSFVMACGRATPETALWRLEGQCLWAFCLTIFFNHSTLSLKIFSTFRSSKSIAGGPSLKAVEAGSVSNWLLPTNQGRGRTCWSQGCLEIPVVQLSFISAHGAGGLSMREAASATSCHF